MRDTTQQWLTIAEADLDAAASMLRTKRLLYAVFQAQQCAEKSLKAVIQERGAVPPRIHDLEALAALAGVPTGMFMPGLNLLSGYYIASRYPRDWDRLSKTTTTVVSHELVALAKEVLAWARETTTSINS